MQITGNGVTTALSSSLPATMKRMTMSLGATKHKNTPFSRMTVIALSGMKRGRGKEETRIIGSCRGWAGLRLLSGGSLSHSGPT